MTGLDIPTRHGLTLAVSHITDGSDLLKTIAERERAAVGGKSGWNAMSDSTNERGPLDMSS